MDWKPRIFVGSSSEALPLANHISKVIESERMTPVMWDADAFMLGRTLIEQIESFPFEFSGAVLLVTPDLRCRREGYEPFMAPVANIIFEYGYLGARLARDRVAVCRFWAADMPSNAQGVKLIEAGDVSYGAPELPLNVVRNLADWLRRLPSLAEGVPPTTQLHGYSGRWKIRHRFKVWKGFNVVDPDSVYFDGSAFLSIPMTGRGGSGMTYGAAYISMGQYRARLDVVNEIRDAVVDQDGNLTLTIEVVRRHLAEENGDPPDGRVREDLQSKDFEERLECFSGQPRALRGVHEYQQNLAPYSSAVVEYIQVR
jgi:hypothetical protein